MLTLIKRLQKRGAPKGDMSVRLTDSDTSFGADASAYNRG